MIELISINKSFGTQKVLTNISANFKTNSVSLILGQSGEGKTVLSKLIVGLIKPDSGKLLFDGEDITDYTEPEFMKVRKKCCYNFQLPALFRAKTVYENVALPLTWQGPLVIDISDRVMACLSKVGLQDAKDLYPVELSYGMQKRVSFARAMLMDPNFIIFDEPTSGLDPMSALQLFELIKDFASSQNKGAIVITHDIDAVKFLQGEVYLLKTGRFLFSGSSSDFFKSKESLIKDFLSSGDPE